MRVVLVLCGGVRGRVLMWFVAGVATSPGPQCSGSSKGDGVMLGEGMLFSGGSARVSFSEAAVDGPGSPSSSVLLISSVVVMWPCLSSGLSSLSVVDSRPGVLSACGVAASTVGVASACGMAASRVGVTSGLSLCTLLDPWAGPSLGSTRSLFSGIVAGVTSTVEPTGCRWITVPSLSATRGEAPGVEWGMVIAASAVTDPLPLAVRVVYVGRLAPHLVGRVQVSHAPMM